MDKENESCAPRDFEHFVFLFISSNTRYFSCDPVRTRGQVVVFSCYSSNDRVGQAQISQLLIKSLLRVIFELQSSFVEKTESYL